MTATHPASSAAPLLSIQDLSIALPAGGDRPYAVRNISFDINAGEILCIVGESGSGKSMSANAIMGLLPLPAPRGRTHPCSTTATCSRWTNPRCAACAGREMAMIFQEPLSALNPLLTVGEQIEEVMRVHNAYPEQERAQPRARRCWSSSACPSPG